MRAGTNDDADPTRDARGVSIERESRTTRA
jgi:hypothetical protein